METLEVNMYVRTKLGIGKLLYFNEELEEWVNEEYNYYTEDFIVKASHNIIDLIEVGDYVNGYKLLYQDSHYSYFDTDTCDWIYIKKDEQIKSIVTKERFEAMQYEIK